MAAMPGNAPPTRPSAKIIEKMVQGVRESIPAPKRNPDCPGHCKHGRCRGETVAHGGCRHDGCEIPGCPACCPVRPASFGFYGTQWRVWPGQEVTPAERTEPVGPVLPPKSEVPTADEESPIPGFEPAGSEPTAEVPDATGEQPSPMPGRQPRSAPGEKPETGVLPVPRERPAPERMQPPKPATPDEKSSPDENLFDEAGLRRRSQQRFLAIRQAAFEQERLHREALRQQADRQVARPSQPPRATPAGTAPDAPPQAAPLPTAQQASHSAAEKRMPVSAIQAPRRANPLR